MNKKTVKTTEQPAETAVLQQQSLPLWLTGGLIPLVQLVLAFVLASLLVLVIGEDPLETMRVIFQGAFVTPGGFSFTLYYATSLIFTGLAVMVAFHAGLFNIGGEGQAYFAGLGVALVCLSMDSFLPAPLMFLMATLAALVFGAAWAYIAGYLQAKRGAHVVVTTIMLNYIAAALISYVMVRWLRSGDGSVDTRTFNPDALLPRFSQLFPDTMVDSPLNIAFFLALLAAAWTWWLIWRARLGYEIRVVGQNQQAAQYAGISVSKIIIVTMMISGALAGLMAVNVVYGAQARLSLGYTSGVGFMGIAVALMGRNHPVGVVLAAILFGALTQGGSEMQFEMPQVSREFNIVIQGLVIFFVTALDQLIRKPIERWYQKTRGA